MTEAFATAALTAVLTFIPTVIVSITGLVLAVKSTNKKTVESAKGTNQIVVETTTVNSDKIDEVHNKVNGEHSALTAELVATRKENIELREQLARLGSKRSSDTGDTPNG